MENGGNGQLINVVFAVISNSGADVSFRTVEWVFTRQTAEIGGRISHDEDLDGTQDDGEFGWNDVTVYLIDALSDTMATATTSGDGEYLFIDLPWGEFSVAVDASSLPADYAPTYDPDGVETSNRSSLFLACGESSTDQDFGYASFASGVAADAGESTLLLRPIAPNPIRPGTRIEFAVPQPGFVELAVFDLSSRRVATLLKERLPAGRHSVRWTGLNDRGERLAGGIYQCELRTDEGRSGERIVLLK